MAKWIGKNTKAVAFLRISSTRQEGNTSHETQEKEIRAYCEKNGLDLCETITLIESAKDSDKRKKYSKARHQAIRKSITHFVFYIYDRETRNLTDNENNEKLVRQGKIALHYVKENKIIHQESPDSDFFMRDIQAVTNKQYIRSLSTKVIDGMKTKAESGWYPSNRPPLGYMTKPFLDERGRELKRGTTITRDAIEKKVRQVQREFELRAKGYSYQGIRNKVVAEGFIDPLKISAYRDSAIEYRLKNPFYYGRFMWRGVEYQGNHELIIPKTVLNQVEESFQKRSSKRVMKKGGVFSGWLNCAVPECGRSIIYDPKQKKMKPTGEMKTYHFYHCSDSRRVHGKQQNVSEDKIWKQLEPAVESISITRQRAKDIADALNVAHDRACATVRKQIQVYTKILTELEDKEDLLYEDVKAGILDDEAYHRQIKKVRVERRHYTRLLEQAQLNLNGAYRETAQSILELASEAKSLWLSMEPHKRREFLEKVLSNQVLNGKTVEYDLRKPFGTIAKMGGNAEWWAHLGQFRTECMELVA